MDNEFEAGRKCRNRLLLHLAAEDRKRLRPYLRPVKLECKEVLYAPHSRIGYAYFIEEGVASVVSNLKGGESAEVGTIGNEGVAGLPILLEDGETPRSVYVQVAGAALRVEADILRHEMQSSAAVRTALLHYAHAFFNEVTQSVACARFHTVEQRCCRWLLMTQDRMGSDEFALSQEFLGMMLGVRRAGVSEAASRLKHARAIDYRRGRVVILDRRRLEARACECYAAIQSEYIRLLGSASRTERNIPNASTPHRSKLPRLSA